MEETTGSIDTDTEIILLEEEEDPEFSMESNPEQIKPSLNVSLSKGDTIILSMNNSSDQIVDHLCEIMTIHYDDEIAELQTESKEIIQITYTSENEIVLVTDTYQIFELFVVDPFKYDDLDKPSLMLTKDLFPEINLLVTELDSNKVYSQYEKKHSIINELISLFKAHGDEPMIHTIYEIVDSFQSMIDQQKDTYSDNTDIFPFIKEMIYKQTFQLPSWFIPISDVKKRLFKVDEEDPTEQPDTFHMKLEDYLQSYETSVLSSDIPHYKQMIQNIQFDKPYQAPLQPNSISYTGVHIRDCNERSPCNGLNGIFYPDVITTKQELKIPIFQKQETTLEVISQKETINVSGFFSLPITFMNYTMKPNFFSLYEHDLLSNENSKPFIQKFRKEQIIPNMIGKDTTNTTILQHTNIHSFHLNDVIPKEDMGLVLQNNIPNISEFIDSYPKQLLEQIYSFQDFSLLFSPYQISIQDLSPEKRRIMKQTIKSNILKYIQTYNRSVKRKITKKLKPKVKILSESEKITILKKYVNSLSVIPLRNQYTKKIIDRYSRKAIGDENKDYLYEKNSSSILFCNHYLYSCESHKDPQLFHTMRSLFGGHPEDGIVPCRVCGEYLCHEEFSTFQGYDDGSNTLEKATEDDTIELFTEEQQTIANKIKKISSFLSVELNMYDIKRIISYLQLITQKEIMNHRYKTPDGFKEHPQYKQINDAHPSISKPKTTEERKQNKINQRKKLNELKQFKLYLEDSNSFLIITFLCLFHLQTSIPPYISSVKQNMNLLDKFTSEQTWSDFTDNINDHVSIFTIDRLVVQTKQFIQSSKKDPFWEHIELYISEQDTFPSVSSFKEQFSDLLPFILKNEQFKQSLQLYFEYEQTAIRNVYYKESWSAYKPQKDNTIVQGINEIIQNEDGIKDLLLIQKGEYSYENISSIVSIQQSKEVPRFKRLSIPYSEIMRNESYRRLFQYSIHLHGKTQGDTHPINLQLQQFLNTSEYSDEILSLFVRNGWNSDTKQMKPFNYSDFRQMIVKDITDLFKQKDPSNIDTLDTYIHIGLNNWNGMLLNGNPKRNYSYKEPIVFPDTKLSSIIEISPKLIDALYKSFCYDEDNDIQYRFSNDDFIMNLVADPTVEREAVCERSIDINDETFRKILDFKCNSKKHPLVTFPQINIDTFFETKVYEFITNNQLLQFDAADTFPIYQRILAIPELPKEKHSNEWDIIISSLMTVNDNIKDTIQEFFQENKDVLREQQIQRYNSLFGRSLDSLQIILSKVLEQDRNIHNSIKMIFRIMGRLSHTRQQQGTIFHNHIPKQWKLSETNETYYKEFITINEFSLHNDLFLKKQELSGFNIYKKDDTLKDCFQKLYSFLQKHNIRDLETIIGSNSYYLTEDYSLIFKGHQLLSLFALIIEYITDLKDKETDDINDTGELYSSLIERDQTTKNKCISVLTQFSFDLLVHIIEEYIDPSWIYQDKSSISDRLGKQKEREKQTIIEKLETQTDEHRLVSGFLQNFGIIEGAYKGSERANLEHIESTKYEQQIQEETAAAIETLFFEKGDEEGYDQHDQDREDEGLDDNDDDGDYQDN